MRDTIWAFIILALTFVVILMMGVFVIYNNDQLSKAMEEEQVSLGSPEIANNNTKQEESANLETKKEVLDDFSSKSIVEQTKKLLYDFEFSKAHEQLSEAIRAYSLEGLPDSIKVLREETALLSNFKAMLESNHSDMVIDAIKSLKDVDAFLASSLFLNQEDRRYLIESIKSINPVFKGTINLISKKNITEDYLSEGIEELHSMTSIEEVYRHEFKLEGNIVRSYIVKTEGEFRIATMIGDASNKTRYYTIEEWDSLFK